MIFRQWKPGIRWRRRSTIDGNNKVTREERNREIEEIRETKGILDLRKDISGKGILRSERFRISLRLAIAILGLANITATSHGHKGTIFDIVQLESRTSDREICELSSRFIETSDRKVKMTQSQLVGKNGDVQSEEGMHKRLKISVPHFDNYDLIKGYSKTLIGRCRNPAEQDIKALIVTFSKIWNLVDRVVGVDLGLGRFQFDSDHEEDIEATPDVRSQEKKKMKENRDRDDGKHDDRARSYKGVVIKGNNDVQDKEREKREYYGKGKGKMIEEPESRWTKVSDRGNKRYNGYNGNKGHFRGMEEGSRHRSRRWEPARAYTHEERHPHGGRRERSPRVVIREDAREEGEVQTKQPGKVQLNQSMPSAVFQVDLAKTQAEPTEVNLALVDDDASLYLANEALENVELGDDLMVMEDNIGIEDIVENQDKVGEDFQDLTDEELEEESKKENGGEAVVED
ncbi:hypothetical protein Bca4012_065334 [Brassica carinata]